MKLTGWFVIQSYKLLSSSVGDPDPQDPHVFGPLYTD
jgi:hypothetical protein